MRRDLATMEFSGGAMHPSLPRGRCSGKLVIQQGQLQLLADGAQAPGLPLAGLRIQAGGAGDRLIFFSHESHPEWSLFTDQSAILDHPDLARKQDVRQQVQRARGIRRRAGQWLSIVIFVVMVALVGLFMARHTLVRIAADRVPENLEGKLGTLAFEQIRLGAGFLDDADLKRDLTAIFAPLEQALPKHAYSYTLYLQDDASINAFALPGGIIVVHTGLILAARTPEEVAGVLAHELAHVTQRHGIRGMIGGTGRFVVLQAVLGDIAGLSGALIASSDLLIRQKYSRDFEREADEVGWHYLVTAGINPAGMVSFFETLKQQEMTGAAGAAMEWLTLLQTHPATAERLAEMSQRLANLPPQEW